MAYDLTKRLVIGLASSAFFDLEESDQIFRTKGEQSYRNHQRTYENEPLKKGVSFPFIKRLLSLNSLNDENEPLVEVILLSRNDPDTGLRVMNSIEHYKLNITRAVFCRENHLCLTYLLSILSYFYQLTKLMCVKRQ